MPENTIDTSNSAFESHKPFVSARSVVDGLHMFLLSFFCVIDVFSNPMRAEATKAGG